MVKPGVAGCSQTRPVQIRPTQNASQNPRVQDRTLNLPSFFRYKHIALLKTTFRLDKVRVFATGFEATFTALFVFIYWLREIPLSAVTNLSELRYQLKQLLLLYYKIWPCFLCWDDSVVAHLTAKLMFVPALSNLLHMTRRVTNSR